MQIHHIDEDPSNNDESNLAVLCVICHNDTQINGGFGRKLSSYEVKLHKEKWEATVSAQRESQTSIHEVKELIGEIGLPELESWESVEDGVQVDQAGNSRISIHPTVFFSERVTSSFPGLRGLRIIGDLEDAIYRLWRLLRTPTYFNEAKGHGIHADPVWWFRGFRALPIRLFQRIESNIVLMNNEELKLRRIAAYTRGGGAYFHSFVYVEVEPMEQIGVNAIDLDKVELSKPPFDYYAEEYALLNGKPITREYHDDGFMEEEGRIVSTAGSIVRQRYLTPYNFLIASKTSPMNDRRLEDQFGKILGNILKGTSQIEALVELMSSLPKSHLDS